MINFRAYYVKTNILAYNFIIFCNFEKGVHIFLANICLVKVEEVHYCQEIIIFHSPHVDYWERVDVLLQQVLEETARRSQDHLVRLHLLTILTGQSHIGKVFVTLYFPKSYFELFLGVVQFQAVFFHHVSGLEAKR